MPEGGVTGNVAVLRTATGSSIGPFMVLPPFCHYLSVLSRGHPAENADISQALSKLTEPSTVPIPRLSVSNMVHSARKRIRRHRRPEESPLSNDVLNSVLQVRGQAVSVCVGGFAVP